METWGGTRMCAFTSPLMDIRPVRRWHMGVYEWVVQRVPTGFGSTCILLNW